MGKPGLHDGFGQTRMAGKGSPGGAEAVQADVILPQPSSDPQAFQDAVASKVGVLPAEA